MGVVVAIDCDRAIFFAQAPTRPQDAWGFNPKSVLCDYQMSHNKTIPMIDLPRVHAAYQSELDEAVFGVINSGSYIGGPAVTNFQERLTNYLQAPSFGVGNGTDALQIALMALGVGPGDEVIVPAFTYAASAEVIALLGATAVWCDVDARTFNIDPESAKLALSAKTKAIIAVHLYGQLADLEALENAVGSVPIIEDTAQSFGARFTCGKYQGKYAGTVGAVGTLSFFPTKPLGAMGDGGAVITHDKVLFDTAQSIARHGQSKKYVHDIIGVNSRLDPIHAVVLNVKLNYFEATLVRKQQIAALYKSELANIEQIKLPELANYTSHVWHQFTLKVVEEKRDGLQIALKEAGVSTMIYYPIALPDQKAYKYMIERVPIETSRLLCRQALSLPIDPSMSNEDVHYICQVIMQYF